MRELETIQKMNKLNTVYAMDEPGPGGACHRYNITGLVPSGGGRDVDVWIDFQKGPRKDPSSIPGILDTDLLEIVRDRLTAFQNGDFACEYNAEALDYINKALEAMNPRVALSTTLRFLASRALLI